MGGRRKHKTLTIHVTEQLRRSLATAAWTEGGYRVSDRYVEDINSKKSSFS